MKLVIGQSVYMCSGIYFTDGVVTKVATLGLNRLTREPIMAYEVESEAGWWRGPLPRLATLHFDNNFNGLDEEGSYECGRWDIWWAGPAPKEVL